MRLAWLLVVVVLSACAAPQAVTPPDAHVPPFARVPYEPISRDAVVAIALREWRLFGSPVDDSAPPGTYHPATPQDKPERQQGLWQRVGEYWWLALNAGAPEAAWTGKHDANGSVFPAERGWQLRLVGRVRFLRHADRRRRRAVPIFRQPFGLHQHRQAAGARIGRRGWLITAERPETYAPQPGDLICLGRGGARDAALSTICRPGHFPGHCDIVVDTSVPGQISVVGGNVDDAVTMKHVPVTPDGKLATPDGVVLDTRYPWMVVLRLLLPSSGAPVADGPTDGGPCNSGDWHCADAYVLAGISPETTA